MGIDITFKPHNVSLACPNTDVQSFLSLLRKNGLTTPSKIGCT